MARGDGSLVDKDVLQDSHSKWRGAFLAVPGAFPWREEDIQRSLLGFAPLFAQPGLVKSCASAETATAATFAGMEFVLLLFGADVRYL